MDKSKSTKARQVDRAAIAFQRQETGHVPNAVNPPSVEMYTALLPTAGSGS